MSQTDPKSQQNKTNVPAGKPAAAQPPSKGGPSKPGKSGGSQGLWYGTAVLLVVAIFAVVWVQKNSEKPRPVVSAAEEGDVVAAPDVEEAGETEVASEMDAASGTEAAADLSAPALVIDSNVRGADVYLNGKRVGRTPHKATPLQPGDYDVRVEQAGYETFTKQVHVETPDESIRAELRRMSRPVAAREEEEDEDAMAETAEAEPAADIRAFGQTLAAKHNHRIGSCEGVLRTTSTGVRFETDHKDAFFVAYADIEELALDGDNLTLRVHEGRKYDFKEQNDNVEALADFHRAASQAVAGR